jgi:NAD(P)-dependent dehydrogenase (short-subunit alcohol dehydrogenase family)
MSAIRLTRHYLPGMMQRGWGRVQFMASDSAVVIPEEMVHYGVTKTALLGVSRGFAKAAKGSGVTVNSVIAGPTHTEGVEDFVYSLVGSELEWDDAQRRFVAEHRPNSLLGRLIEPDEIANLVAYLSSDLASATTGGAVRVDGGYVDHILP